MQREQSANEIADMLEHGYKESKDLNSKVDYVCQLRTQYDQAGLGVCESTIDGCKSALHACIKELKKELSSLLSARPEWLYDSFGSHGFGE